jgi:hypothetical protein
MRTLSDLEIGFGSGGDLDPTLVDSNGGGGGGDGGGGGGGGSFVDGANGVLDAAGRGALIGGTLGSLAGPEGTALGAAAGAVYGAGVKILVSPGRP